MCPHLRLNSVIWRHSIRLHDNRYICYETWLQLDVPGWRFLLSEHVLSRPLLLLWVSTECEPTVLWKLLLRRLWISLLCWSFIRFWHILGIAALWQRWSSLFDAPHLGRILKFRTLPGCVNWMPTGQFNTCLRLWNCMRRRGSTFTGSHPRCCRDNLWQFLQCFANVSSTLTFLSKPLRLYRELANSVI